MALQRAAIGLGANLDQPEQQLTDAIQALRLCPGLRVVAVSPLYRSAPVGYLDQPDFVNAVVLLDTEQPPATLLQTLLALEQRFGRVRDFPNAPRTLDLDLLLVDDIICHQAGLTLPHPRMHQRAFVLRPLLDVWPDVIIPGCGPGEALLAAILDQPLQPVLTT